MLTASTVLMLRGCRMPRCPHTTPRNLFAQEGSDGPDGPEETDEGTEEGTDEPADEPEEEGAPPLSWRRGSVGHHIASG